MHTFETHFQLLELDQTATLDEMKQAYRDLVMVWHPDRFGQNVRLREKAERKLKQFNQAYEHLKQWYTRAETATHTTSSSKAKPQPSGQKPPKGKPPEATKRRSSSSPPPHADASRSRQPPPHVKTSGLYITFAHAEYILEHYCFSPVLSTKASQPEEARHYQSGPFLLTVCAEPLALTLSVPCSSLQGFDRILLSIPCKSTGHFFQEEAQQLLGLLHTQSC